MEGIDSLKKVLALPMSLHEAIEAAGADGKVDMADIGLLVGPASKIGDFVAGLKDVPKQISDLDESERKEVMAWAKKEYDLSDDHLEERVESGLSLALHIAEFVGKLTRPGKYVE